jgi:hypothetical protein
LATDCEKESNHSIFRRFVVFLCSFWTFFLQKNTNLKKRNRKQANVLFCKFNLRTLKIYNFTLTYILFFRIKFIQQGIVSFFWDNKAEFITMKGIIATSILYIQTILILNSILYVSIFCFRLSPICVCAYILYVNVYHWHILGKSPPTAPFHSTFHISAILGTLACLIRFHYQIKWKHYRSVGVLWQVTVPQEVTQRDLASFCSPHITCHSNLNPHCGLRGFLLVKLGMCWYFSALTLPPPPPLLLPLNP